MASLIEDLMDILEKEHTIYEQLIPIASEKTQIIVKNDLTELARITGMEQSAVDKISALEHRRDEVIKNIGTVINKKPASLNLKTLINLLEKQPREQKCLADLHDKLKQTIQKLVDINNRNKMLIQQSLEMIEFNMNFIQSTRMSMGNNYTKGASEYSTAVSDKSMFDAKQ